VLDESTVNSLPESSGVYVFRDRQGDIIYIGKARSIRDRVRSYLRVDDGNTKTETLARKIASVETVLTSNEKEAFLLENNLIKEHSPRYNINLKDDKTYVSLKLTANVPFPALYVTREIIDDGATYFGPYPHARDMRDVLKLIQALYPIRRCKDTVFGKRKRPCILAQLGKCVAPCSGEIDGNRYRELVEELKDFLSGKDGKLLKDLEVRISAAAGRWDFEEARRLKERYLAIRGMTEKQHVHEHLGKNRDLWAIMDNEKGVKIVLLSFRRGVLIAKKIFKEPTAASLPSEALSSFLFQYYRLRPVPEEIIISEDLDDKMVLGNYLKERKGGPVRLRSPGDRGVKEMVDLAVENLHEAEPIALGEAFRLTLRLKREPRRIEVYDISHTRGTNPSGAMVVFDEFKMKKDAYRVFHIRGESTMDDTASIAEVLHRRLHNEKLGPLPDLFVIDGGKGQLSAASKALKEVRLDLDVLSIAKGEGRKKMEEVIYLRNRKNPLRLPKASPVFKELVKMRDEAHRFAITSHKKWKRREDLS
jgi:excinuclease ABC subunit C